jgi:hypothetical protein
MTTHKTRPRALHTILLPIVLSSLLAACGGGGSDPAPAVTPPPAAAVTPATINGKVVAPDGATPIANALVYIENSVGSVSASGAQKLSKAAPITTSCGTVPDASWAYTCSGNDGSFTLKGQIPTSAKLTAVKGTFKVETPLGAPVAGVITQGNVAFVIDNATGNTAPKIAVVTGSFDSIEDILAKLGFGELVGGKLKLGTEKFKLYDGNGALGTGYESSDKLFVDADGDGKPDIFKYTIVFWNCGTDEAVPLTAANKEILRQYVQGGGKLYASDLAYDIVEQVFPAYIDFYGSDGVVASTAENMGVAEVGISDITVNATVDPALQAWLRSVTCAGGSCVQADGTVKIEGFLSGWGVINGAHTGSTGVKTWASGAVDFASSTGVVKPLTMSFPVGSGRVTYTSYHNEAQVGAELEPQQRILQYLVFELI